MDRWALIDGDTVATVTLQEEQPVLDGLWVLIPEGFGPGDKYVDGEFVDVTPGTTIPPVRITQMAFDLRLTADERKAIRAAAKVNVDIDDAYRLKEKATFIDLTAQITYNLLGVMVMAGCIAPERMPVILDTSTVQPDDLYRGPT